MKIILISLIVIIVGYVAFRLWAYAVAESYFQTKEKYNKEGENVKK